MTDTSESSDSKSNITNENCGKFNDTIDGTRQRRGIISVILKALTSLFQTKIDIKADITISCCLGNKCNTSPSLIPNNIAVFILFFIVSALMYTH